MDIRTTHRLLTGQWTADVDTVEGAIGRFKADPAVDNDCHVAFFEVVRDGHLHVNVTHKHQTRPVPGWAGPAHLLAGFTHNRTFGAGDPDEIVRHVRKMIFAARN